MRNPSAVFLDRDGVITPECGLITYAEQLTLLPGVSEALKLFANAGLKSVLVTNQAVVARGIITESELDLIHEALQQMLMDSGAPKLDAIYACPHHPCADLPEYRIQCGCRKPASGMLQQAAEDHQIDIHSSFMIGDRLTDIAAGRRVGCRSILLKTTVLSERPIVTRNDEYLRYAVPHVVCSSLADAAAWVLNHYQGS